MTVLKRTILTAVAIIISIVAVTVAYSTSHKTKSSNPKQKPKATITTNTFTVKEYNGKIAVFENGSSEPIKTIESPYIRDLPENDQILLAQGITVNGEAELNKLLEDYDN